MKSLGLSAARPLQEGLRGHVRDHEQEHDEIETGDEQELPQRGLRLRGLGALLRGERVEPPRLRQSRSPFSIIRIPTISAPKPSGWEAEAAVDHEHLTAHHLRVG